MYTLDGWWFLSSGGPYPPVFTVEFDFTAGKLDCWSPGMNQSFVLNLPQKLSLLWQELLTTSIRSIEKKLQFVFSSFMCLVLGSLVVC